MTNLYSDGDELMSSIKHRSKKMEYQPSLTDSDYQFEQTGVDSFAINQRYLRSADSANGERSCQGFYYNGGRYTYDPPPFYVLRVALATQGYISLNTSEYMPHDVVIASFLLNGRRFKIGDGFQSAIYHANRATFYFDN